MNRIVRVSSGPKATYSSSARLVDLRLRRIFDSHWLDALLRWAEEVVQLIGNSWWRLQRQRAPLHRKVVDAYIRERKGC